MKLSCLLMGAPFARRPVSWSSLAADLLLQCQDIGEESQPKGGTKCAGE